MHFEQNYQDNLLICTCIAKTLPQIRDSFKNTVDFLSDKLRLLESYPLHQCYLTNVSILNYFQYFTSEK